jgi:hypothetical protein
LTFGLFRQPITVLEVCPLCLMLILEREVQLI